jgi:hypothetical protein
MIGSFIALPIWPARMPRFNARHYSLALDPPLERGPDNS